MPSRFKLYFNNSIWRFQLDNYDYESFLEELKKYGYRRKKHKIEYLDDENEWVTIRIKSDWTEAHRIFKIQERAKCTRVRVTKLHHSKEHHAPKSSLGANLESAANIGEEFLQKILKRSGDIVNDFTKSFPDLLNGLQLQEAFSNFTEKMEQSYPKQNQNPDEPKRQEQTQFASNQAPVFGNLKKFCFVPKNYVCDGCDVFISGERYHCTECVDYDLCDKCLGKENHVHTKYVHYPSKKIINREGNNSEESPSSMNILDQVLLDLRSKLQDEESKSSQNVDSSSLSSDLTEEQQLDGPKEHYFGLEVENEYPSNPLEESQQMAPPYKEYEPVNEPVDDQVNEAEDDEVTIEKMSEEEVIVPEVERDLFEGDERLRNDVSLLQSMGFSLKIEELINLVRTYDHNLRAIVEKLLED